MVQERDFNIDDVLAEADIVRCGREDTRLAATPEDEPPPQITHEEYLKLKQLKSTNRKIFRRITRILKSFGITRDDFKDGEKPLTWLHGQNSMYLNELGFGIGRVHFDKPAGVWHFDKTIVGKNGSASYERSTYLSCPSEGVTPITVVEGHFLPDGSLESPAEMLKGIIKTTDDMMQALRLSKTVELGTKYYG